MNRKTPAAEFPVDSALVRRLLADQHPDLARLPVRAMAAGWDNAMFRLGDSFTVRLPRRQMGGALIRHEQRWLPVLAPRLPLPTPCPVRIGRPALGYPWHWSVCPWLPGVPAAQTPPRDPAAAARTLGAFGAALHIPAPADAPVNPHRGVPLADRAKRVATRLRELTGLIDAPAATALWRHLVAQPPWPGPPLWLHGDLHAFNVLVQDGGISAVLDFGDLTAGDPAPDLAIAWMLFAPPERALFRAAHGGIDDALWARGRGWGLVFALEYLANSADNQPLHDLGRRLLDAVLADAA